MPFVYSVPRFPINKEKRPAPSFSEVGAEPPDEHIPVWLPAFPETKLCDQSEEANVGTVEGEVPSKENGSLLPSRLEVVKSPKDVRKSTEGEEEAVEGNPFLTAPLLIMEKEVSPVLQHPLEVSNEVVSINHVSDKHTSNNYHIPVLEASEINKKTRVADSENGEKNGGVIPQQTLVRFKIGSLKRLSCLAVNRSVQEQAWFREGADKREKKSAIDEERERIDSDVN
ncbi:unnamed protein product [Microthlaspi erraticum]|uniref:Uncharacterized protein n=1 Tax=Microthlaspi erraticum TaxID=1685480 RepID=A0A6D2JHQ1_9BRAS|nr:unnamed protein product [Microthlaspi erraticum]